MIGPLTMSWEQVLEASDEEVVAAYRRDGLSQLEAEATVVEIRANYGEAGTTKVGALRHDKIGTRLVTDLAELKAARRRMFIRDGYRLLLQPAEADAGMTQAEVDVHLIGIEPGPPDGREPIEDL